ncbi:MAG: AMP-binding protein [Alphaproteobacteria bacterium]|nr:AMP-binding protein [Alphaproteobacteria bacterium]
MVWPDDFSIPLRRETHFGDRVVRCFVERANDVDTAFRDSAARFADKPALVFEGKRLSYAELDRQVDTLAANLAAQCGVGAGDRVALYSGNCLEFPLTVLACLRLGAIAVPLGHRLQTQELGYMLGHAAVKVVMVEAALADRLPARDSLPAGTRVFAWEGEAPGCEAFESLLAAAPPLPRLALDEDQPAAILYDTFDSRDLSCLRVGGFGGAPMPEATIDELARRMPALTLRNAYGATETTSPATMLPLGKVATHKHTVGRPLPCADVMVVDEAARELAAGETGEIWIAGPMVIAGYWRNDDADASEFSGGYWHSGDIGRFTDDGYLEILDRAKDMINRGGYKVFSAEVENILSQHPAVVECAVVGRPDEVLGERVHAFVVGEGEGFPESLSDFCRERLADYKAPESYTVVPDTLPRNANGKIIKARLRDDAAALGAYRRPA